MIRMQKKRKVLKKTKLKSAAAEMRSFFSVVRFEEQYKIYTALQAYIFIVVFGKFCFSGCL